MKLVDVGELSLLKEIRGRFAGRSALVATGIGDDSAVLKTDKGFLLVTSDMMVEGVHFDLSLCTPYQLGYKLVSVNISDIYAMGGRPRHIVMDIAAPSETDKRFIGRLLDGVKDSLGKYGASLVGGDLSASPSVLALSASAIGYAIEPVRRVGARPGDLIYVTGHLGDSACGLMLLKHLGRCVEIERGRRLNKKPGWDVIGPLIRRHVMPVARKPFKGASAMIDISDGLFIDLTRLLDESRVGARIDLSYMPLSDALVRASAFLGLDPLEMATRGGEDYELLFTAPPERRIRGAFCIGEITRKGRIATAPDGKTLEIKGEGYSHFRL